MTIWEYTMEPEENGSGQPIEVGVFSHEFGHFIGLPDLYDTDYSSGGMGLWCLMASGSYAGGSDYPAHMNVWCKMKLGLGEPDEYHHQYSCGRNPADRIGTGGLPYLGGRCFGQ